MFRCHRWQLLRRSERRSFCCRTRVRSAHTGELTRAAASRRTAPGGALLRSSGRLGRSASSTSPAGQLGRNARGPLGPRRICNGPCDNRRRDLHLRPGLGCAGLAVSQRGAVPASSGRNCLDLLDHEIEERAHPRRLVQVRMRQQIVGGPRRLGQRARACGRGRPRGRRYARAAARPRRRTSPSSARR